MDKAARLVAPHQATGLPGPPVADGGVQGDHRAGSVDVVVTVFNKRPFLEASLGSILQAAESSRIARVTVLDHGSTDGSLELGIALCRGRARHVVVSGGTIATLRNAGAKGSDRPILSFIDADCVVPPGYFEALSRVMANPEVAATGRRVDYPTDGSWVERTWHAMHHSASEGFRKYLNSGNFAIRREVFERFGGFAEALITGEDSELGQRLNDGGFRIWESADLAVVHLDNPRSLLGFFRKEVWHARGMLATRRVWPPHLPLIGAALHGLLLMAAVFWLALGAGALWGRLAVAFGLVFVVPVLGVLYRALPQRRRVPWLHAAVLYQAYLIARITALAAAPMSERRRRRAEGR
ncbi:MAG: glycosyltransferase [Acidobacteria bacterium]|nr:glycosyltransferase [Acidobacteriota bacterium]